LLHAISKWGKKKNLKEKKRCATFSNEMKIDQKKNPLLKKTPIPCLILRVVSVIPSLVGRP